MSEETAQTTSTVEKKQTKKEEIVSDTRKAFIGQIIAYVFGLFTFGLISYVFIFPRMDKIEHKLDGINIGTIEKSISEKESRINTLEEDRVNALNLSTILNDQQKDIDTMQATIVTISGHLNRLLEKTDTQCKTTNDLETIVGILRERVAKLEAKLEATK